MPSHQGETIGVLVLGDDVIGKTSLIRSVAEGCFPSADAVKDSPNPVYCCSTDTAVHANDTSYRLLMYDMARHGKEELRKVITQKSSQPLVCYLCFDLAGPASFKRVQLKWKPMLDELKFRGQLYLVGLKEDLASDLGTEKHLASEGLQPITDAEASKLANEIKALSFHKTSSLKYLGIQNLKERTVFDVLSGASSNPVPASDRRKCYIM